MSKTDKINLFKSLTWDDIEDWVGPTIVSRGKNYQRYGYVQELAMTTGGELVAWVEGSRRYITRVDIGPGPQLSSRCSCPYPGYCKHAVAVVLEFLVQTRQQRTIATISTADRRLRSARKKVTEPRRTVDLHVAEEEVAQEDHNRNLRAYLESLSKTELIAMIEELLQNDESDQ